MPYQVRQFLDYITQMAGHLDREHWVTLSFLVLLLGLVCMRGFGSRNNY